MKVWIAKDWRGCHIYGNKPHLLEHLPSFPPTFTGWEWKQFLADNSLADEKLKMGECMEAKLAWGIIFDRDSFKI